MSDEAVPTEAAPDAAPVAENSTPKRKLPLIAGLVIAGVAAGGAAGVLVAGPVIAKRFAAAPAAASAEAPAEGGSHGGKEGKEGKEGEAKGAEAVSFVIDNLVLNPAGSGGSRFLLASVSLRLNSTATKDALALRDAEARDAILRLLGTKQVEELIDVNSRDKIKKEISTIVNGMFPGAKVVQGVFFSQFVIQ